MFEYAEEQILKKIQELDEKIILYEKEENICSRDKEYILSYININSGVNGLKKSVVFSNLLVMFLLVIGVMSGSGYAFLGSLACLSIAGIETFKIIKNNKILKDN